MKFLKNVKVVLFIYDVMVSAATLVFVYWISITETENLDVCIACAIFLASLIVSRNVYERRSFLALKFYLQRLLEDLIKPLLSMVLGLFVCGFLLGDEWRRTKNYALDVGNLVLLLLVVVGMSAFIIIISEIIYRLKDRFQRRTKSLK